jgi:glycosyltransferase involved in cell wall biosynthesis
MRTINQVVAAVTPGDAVSEQAFAWQRLLFESGYPGQVLAEYVDSRMVGQAQALDAAGKELLLQGDAVLHYSVGTAATDVALQSCRRIALYYHNVTPGELLRDFNPALAEECDRGRRQLKDLRDRVAPVLAVSAFNAADLRNAGLGEATVVPLLLDLPLEVPRDARASDPIVLTVGRVVPNKRLEDVIKAFALFQRHRAPEASLVLIGSHSGFENYRLALDRLIDTIGVDRVFFTGPISREARDAWYRRAHVYLSMSVHEGFCAPVVEALAHGAPVVARRAAAVPETLGDAGLILDGDDLPLVAEALHEVVSSAETRKALAEAAAMRLNDLRPEAVAPRIRAALGPILDGT